MTDVPMRILVVEDEPQMQKFLRTCLGAEGYRVIEAAKGQEGLDLARTHNPDLVLLDLGLPDMDGTLVTKGLRDWSTKPTCSCSAARGSPRRSSGSTATSCWRGHATPSTLRPARTAAWSRPC